MSTSTSSFSTKLPCEIIDEIIDQVHDTGNNVDMKNCALVCRDWLPRARTNLFRNFNFPRRIPWSWQTDSARFRDSLASLAEDIKSSPLKPPYSSVVRNLIIRAPLLITPPSHAEPLLPQLPFNNLRSLDLSSPANVFDLTSIHSLLENNPHLENLSLRSFECSLNHFLRFCSMIAAGHTSLSSLKVGYFTTRAPDPTNSWDLPLDTALSTSTPVAEHPPCLRSLSVDTSFNPRKDLETWMEPFFTMHQHFFNLSSLRCLTLPSNVPSNHPLIFQRCGPSLTHLVLTWFSSTFFSPSVVSSFKHLIKLVDLTLLEIVGKDISEGTLAILKDILAIVQQLEHLCLEFASSTFGDHGLHQIDNLLDSLLQTVGTTGLKKLTLRISTLRNVTEDEILAHLPAISGRVSVEILYHGPVY
ncbi:hypothetical protein D9758_003605 [Tetrapyrgos nigripes]|uniref:F-box domain-containing protein n=1 Tax=Tetrapyrgos nigripes TaxID=182062 RepID=A0A8H5GM59_9AGAR|nr:hypothetical protein D9758_003605 [Tetrapyrgos nigripes]